MMRYIFFLFLSVVLLFCTSKGPKTYKSSFVGKTKADLINAKGVAKEIKIFGNTEAYIYIIKEEYFGKKVKFNTSEKIMPKRSFITEHIYYINEKSVVYKYQVWKKKLK